MSDRETVPPPNQPHDMGNLIGDALLCIADDLDATRDLAANGNKKVIEAVGDLRARVVEVDEKNSDSHAETQRMVRKLYGLLENIRDDQAKANDRISQLEKKMMNGHASAE